jgi:hypothetical protein
MIGGGEGDEVTMMALKNEPDASRLLCLKCGACGLKGPTEVAGIGDEVASPQEPVLVTTTSTMGSVYNPPSSSSKPYVEPAAFPDDLPKVSEIGTTSGPLKSAAFFIGAYCKDFNGP